LIADFSFTGSVPGIWVADYYGSELSKMLLINEGADPREKPGWVFKMQMILSMICSLWRIFPFNSQRD